MMSVLVIMMGLVVIITGIVVMVLLELMMVILDINVGGGVVSDVKDNESDWENDIGGDGD